jgi:hypothetical protein
MSIVKANRWILSDLNANERVAGVPLKIQQVTVPYSTASFSGGYITLPSVNTSNTASLHSFTYTPVSSSSFINIQAFLEGDRSSSGNSEHLFIFVNNVPLASSLTYPRLANNEPWQMRGMACTFTNTSTSAVTINIRCRSGGGWTQTIGSTNGNFNIMTNTIQIIEYQR